MKKKKKLLIGSTALLAIVMIVIFMNAGKGKQVGYTYSEDNYEVETLSRRNLVNSISATGTFESNQKTSVSLDLANYKIKNVGVEVGDKVKAGDIICEFDSEDIEESLKQAKKDLETAKKQNTISEKTALRNVSDAKTNRTNQYDTATYNINNAKESWETAVKERDNLKKKYEDAKSKVEKCNNTLKSVNKKTNPQEYTAAQSSLTEAKANRDSLKTQYETAVTTAKSAKSTYEKTVKDRKATDETNASNVASMEASLENTQISNDSTIENLQSQINTYNKQLKKTIVKAESDGVITSLNVTEGQIYAGGDIVVIENPNNLIITAEIEEYEISNITEDMEVKVKTEATGDETLDGKVTYVASVASSNVGSMDSSSMTSSGSSNVTYEIKVTLNNDNERIRLGMSAKMSIVTDEVKNVFAVPYDAIQENESGDKVVYAISQNSDREETSRKEIKVEIGLESSYYIEITGSELEEGMSIYVPIDNSGNSATDEMMNTFERQGR